MGDKPNYDRGTSRDDRSTTKEFVPAVSMPYYKIKENYFFDKATITLGRDTEGAKIYYTTDGSEPTINSTLYTEPFELYKTSEIKFFAKKNGLLTSTVVDVEIKKIYFTYFKNYEGDKLEEMFCANS